MTEAEKFEQEAKAFEEHLMQLGWARVTYCYQCQDHFDRTNMCGEWKCHTPPNGYCHKGRKYGKTD